MKFEYETKYIIAIEDKLSRAVQFGKKKKERKRKINDKYFNIT